MNSSSRKTRPAVSRCTSDNRFRAGRNSKRAIDTVLNQLIRASNIGLTQGDPLGDAAIVTILSGTTQHSHACGGFSSFVTVAVGTVK
jgi:hypothetical protein